MARYYNENGILCINKKNNIVECSGLINVMGDEEFIIIEVSKEKSYKINNSDLIDSFFKELEIKLK